ncbi:sigma-70 family RNA polymerase sigma factor [soil metagenome]
MANLEVDIAQLLPSAQAGSKEALGHILESCRAYLLLIARQEMDIELQAKGSASDLVQQTFLEAQKDLHRFQGSSADALLGWMRRLLLNNLANFRRDLRREKRCAAREVPLETPGEGNEVADELRSEAATPSVALMRMEESSAIASAVERLAPHYREIILLRYREEKSFEAIAEQMQRTPNAVRKLWARAIEQLQKVVEIAQ